MHKQNNFKISIGLEKGKILTCTRNRKGARKTVYSYIDPTMTEPRVEPAPKSGVPDFVTQELKIQRLNDLDIQLSHQKMPVFLLNEPKTKQATILSAGLESDHVRNMLREYKSWLDIDRATVRNNEKEYQNIKPYIDNWDKTFTKSLVEEGKELENLYLKLKSDIDKSNKLNHFIELMTRARNLTNSLPDVVMPQTPQTSFKKEMFTLHSSWTKHVKNSKFDHENVCPENPNINTLLKVVEIYRQWKRSHKKVELLTTASLNIVEPISPELQNLNIQKIYEAWKNSSLLFENTNKNYKEASAELERLNKEYHDVLHETNGVCPTCNQEWNINNVSI